MDESYSDIGSAFMARRSVSSSYGDHQLLSSLIEIKNDLSTEVRALTHRMTHIDEQITQIFHFLSPLQSSVASNPSPVSQTPPPLPPPVSSSSTSKTATPPTTGERLSSYSDINETVTLTDASLTDIHLSERQAPTILTPSTHPASDNEATALCIPPPPSVYNRSAHPPLVSLGVSTTPRGSVSNKIAPAPASAQPASITAIRPISNTRFNPGRSPKPKTRSQQSRSYSKQQQQQPQAEKSTIIELESPSRQDEANRSVPLLSATKSASNVFRRFMTGAGQPPEKNTASSSTLLYPPTSDDERPTSPASSGNDDDDYRPLTSSSNKYHYQTPL